uniref:Uncharacterized protein n=1 Tax=Octopus bimaculoides TaxID=37653 RepID=A0A0L8GY27_OCTBM
MPLFNSASVLLMRPLPVTFLSRRSPSKKQQKLSRSENDKHSSKSSSKSKKDSKDKFSKRESSRKRATESREKDSPKIQPLLVDLTLK